MLGREEIERRFGSTAKSPADTETKHYELRLSFVDLAMILDVSLPDGRAKDNAFLNLEAASMWAHNSLSKRAVPTFKFIGRE